MTRRFSPFLRWCFLLVVVCFALLLALWFGHAPIQAYLHSVTGEEDAWEQIKGFGRLVVLQLANPPLNLEPYAPIAYTGVNPFGVNTFLEQEVEPEKVELALRMIREAGFHWIRQEFPWEDIEQSGRGDFWDHKWNKSAWEKYDRIVALANQYGLQIIARLDNPPAWSRADGDARGTLAPPDDFEDFGNFVYTLVSRYKGKIRYYQIWNEPNIYPEWGEQPVDAAGYVRLLQLAYRRAKEADPDCVILSAGLAQTLETGPKNLNDLIYLQQMYDAGVKGYFDIMGVMAYGLWTGPTDRRTSPELTNFSRPQLIRDIMVRNGDVDKPLWATEVGWNAVPADFPAFPLYGRVTLEQQARYAVQAYQRAQEEWPWMGVLNYWFFKRATDTEIDQVFYYFRMVEPDFTPLPVYEAMKEYANQPPRVYMGYHQEDHWALEWEGDWKRVKDEQALLGAFNRSQESGDVLRFTFVGTELELVVHKSPQGGRCQVSIDGNPPEEINLRSESCAYGVHIPLACGLCYGPHHVEVVTSGPQGTQVDIDGLLVRRP
ncbi:MAG: cellulase family glycosylhydrolase [Anaerolineae bacterium]